MWRSGEVIEDELYRIKLEQEKKNQKDQDLQRQATRNIHYKKISLYRCDRKKKTFQSVKKESYGQMKPKIQKYLKLSLLLT